MIKFQLKSGNISFVPKKLIIYNLELLGLTSLFIFVIYLLNISWRKWCDPQIDFGRELYIPWRMFSGDKWFKDINDLYGPLSRFIDAALFRLFGPGIMVLAWANIIIYFIILFFIYIIIKRAWGISTALLASFIFVGVFSFSQFTITSNYNFVTPYSQQVTHGFLVCLILLWILPNWIESPTYKCSFFVGLLTGLTFVLKPEFILVSCFLMLVAFIYRIKLLRFIDLKSLIVVFIGLIVPSITFFLVFITYLPTKKAYIAACYAWLNSIYIWKDTLYGHLLDNFSGMDHPWLNLKSHLMASILALTIIGFVVIVTYIISYFQLLGTRIALGIIVALIIAAIGLKSVVWSETGRCLLGLLLIYFFYNVFKLVKLNIGSDVELKFIQRMLIVVMALALLSRMILNGRIYQYGFIQSSMASITILSVLIEEFPNMLKFKGITTYIYKLSIYILIISGAFSLIGQSKNMENAKTLAVGTGVDLFYTYPKSVYSDGELVKQITETIGKYPPDNTVVVIPEGIMINYLSRKKSTLPEQAFYSTIQNEQNIVKELQLKKPDLVVFMSRDLSEYGVNKYGSKGEAGEYIIKWLAQNYHISSSYGQDPLKGIGTGGILYQRNDM
jgi:hypothetical protein